MACFKLASEVQPHQAPFKAQLALASLRQGNPARGSIVRAFDPQAKVLECHHKCFEVEPTHGWGVSVIGGTQAAYQNVPHEQGLVYGLTSRRRKR